MYQVLHDTNNVTDSGCHNHDYVTADPGLAESNCFVRQLAIGLIWPCLWVQFLRQKQRHQNRAMGVGRG